MANGDFNHLVDQARAVDIQNEIDRRRIHLPIKAARERSGPCPICGGKDRFSINTKKQVWNCRGCGIGGDVIALVCHLDGVPFEEAVRRLVDGLDGPAGYKDNQEPRKAVHKASLSRETRDTRPLALAIWAEAKNPRRTLVEQYLESRALELPNEAAGEAIRFHPTCPFGGERHPAMVCLVRNIFTNEPQGIHRTALTTDGVAVKRNGKTYRLSLGSASGGAIKLDADEDVTQGLCIGEGVETCLAGRQMGFHPVWALGGVNGIANFPILSGLDGLTIFAERDKSNQKAIESCARRWFETGTEILIIQPLIGKDLNDEIRGRHEY